MTDVLERVSVVKFNRGPMHWEMTTNNTTWYVTTFPCLRGKQGYVPFSDVHSWAAKKYPGARIGVKASDIGPACAIACALQGEGEWLWMK